MANEINFNGSINIRKGNLIESFTPGSITIDLATEKGDGGVQVISTASTGEAIGVTDVSVGGIMYARNLDATNYVELGNLSGGAFVPFLKLLAGEYFIGRCGTSAPFAKADTAEVNLQYRILSP